MNAYHLIPNHCIMFLHKFPKKNSKILRLTRLSQMTRSPTWAIQRKTKRWSYSKKEGISLPNLLLGISKFNPTIRKSNPSIRKDRYQPYNQEAIRNLTLQLECLTLTSVKDKHQTCHQEAHKLFFTPQAGYPNTSHEQVT